MNAGAAFSTVFVDELVRCGLQHACLAPGSRSTPLAIALERDERVELHVTIDERSASFGALGIAKASRRPVVVVCTSGTAAANFHPAVVEAHHARVPLIVVTADRPPELRDTAANQTIDQLKLYGDAVRWFCELGLPEAHSGAVAYWRSLACRAWAEATVGPVHVNAPFREPLVPDEGEAFAHPLEGREGGRPWTSVRRAAAPDEATVEHLAAQISATERGAIVVGSTDCDPGPVVELAHLSGWPLIAEASSGLREGDNAISTYDALLRHLGFADEHRPELVIRIGTTVLSRALSAWLPARVPQVLVDAGGAWLDPTRSLGEIVEGDPASLCNELCKALDARDTSPWLESWRSAEMVARTTIDGLLDATTDPSEPRAARDVAAAVPAGAMLGVASSMPVRDLDWFMAPRSRLRVIANRGASGIDGFVSMVVGAGLPTEETVYALAGDLSMIHDQNGLLLARQEGIDAVFVVINNDGGGIFHFLPQARRGDSFERLWGTPHGLDFSKLAALHGCGYQRILDASSLTQAVQSSGEEGGVHLIEVRTDRASNAELHHGVWRSVSEALDRGRGSPT